MQDTILHEGKYLSLKTRSDGKNFTQEFCHEQRCNGEIVSILPVHMSKGMLVKNEFTPAWGEGTQLASITGGFEKSKHGTPIDAVIEEMREEAGIIINDESVIMTLGTINGSKAMDTVYHLFLVDLSRDNYAQGAIQTDGSFMEAQGSVEWMTVPHSEMEPEEAVESCRWLAEACDPMLYALYTRWMIGFLHRPVSREDYA